MTDSRQRIAERRDHLMSQLSLFDRLTASAAERALADAVAEGLVAVEDGLAEQLRFGDALADATGRYLFAAGGKRVRPALAVLTAQLGDGATDAVIAAAQAIELTHLASLYHDDVMDEAGTRRGVPATHTVWSNSVAILTGDLLFARAAGLLAGLGHDVVRIQSDTFERLCLGQLHELMGPRPEDDPVEHYVQVIADKTGSLIAAAARIGVVLSNAPAEYEQPVLAFGEKIGVAFQLVDDVIDLRGGETGKPAGTDIRGGVVTLPLLYLRREAETDASARDLLERLESGSEADHDSPGFLDAVAELHAHDVTSRALEEAHRWAAEAIRALDALPDGVVKRSLTRFGESLVDRTR